MQKNALQENANSAIIQVELMSVAAIAKKLHVPLGTLKRKLHEYNQAAPGNGWASIQPDQTGPAHGKRLYEAKRLPEFKAMLQTKLTARKPGRPKKPTT